jgi:hypothetical protein
MARKMTRRKLGAKRMWIRRWLQAGRISPTEAKQFTRKLEHTGQLLKPAKAAQPAMRGQSDLIAQLAPMGPVVTIQYDPSRFRVEFTAIRRGRPRKG